MSSFEEKSSFTSNLSESLLAQGIEIDESLLLFDEASDIASTTRNKKIESEASNDETKEEDRDEDDEDLYPSGNDDIGKINSEGSDQFGPYDEDYDDYGRTPPRTRMTHKGKKWRDNKKMMSETAESSFYGKITGPLKRRVSLESPRRRRQLNRGRILPIQTDDENNELSHDQRKRATALSRDQARSEKFDQTHNTFLVTNPTSFSATSLSGLNTAGGRSPPVGGHMSLGTQLSETDYPSLPQHESLPVSHGLTPIRSALRVETTNCFSSLSSRPIQTSKGESNVPQSGYQTPQKRSSIAGTDRQTFFKVFTAMLKTNQLTTDKWERSESLKQRQISNYGESEGLRYENKTNDVIWLELQAWFAGLGPTEYDQKLVEMRQCVKGTIHEVLRFRFHENKNRPFTLNPQISVLSEPSDPLDLSSASELFYDAQESVSSSLNESSHHMDSVDTVTGFDERKNLMDNLASPGICFSSPSDYYEPDLRWSLDVCDKERISLMNRALEQVSGLLQKLDRAESYYASSKMFKSDHPVIGEPEFQARMKCLCLWYNLTMQLRSKIDTIGSFLLGPNGARALPWPTWVSDESAKSEASVESGIASPGGSHVGTQPLPTVDTPMHSRGGSEHDIAGIKTTNLLIERATAAKVRFKLEEDEANNMSNPSDSNNSTSTDSSVNVLGNQAPVIVTVTSPTSLDPGSGISGSTNRQISLISQTSSVFSDFGSSQGLVIPEHPYRRFVDKYLKTKGLRKTMNSLNRLIRGPLRRAKLALEKPVSGDHTTGSIFYCNKKSDPTEMDAPENHSENSSGPSSGQSGIGNTPFFPNHPHLEERYSSHPHHFTEEEDGELSSFGTWNAGFRKMNLPSFRATYLFLCRIPIDVVHECLRIRLEQKPVEPSELSIRQLMRECKEVLRLAVYERQKYISRVKAAIYDPGEADREFLDEFEVQMEEFDQHLTLTLEVYLSYLQSFVTMIQSDSSHLISAYQKSLLEEEWSFIKQTCPHIPEGESFSGNTFCQLACGMLKMIGNFLTGEIDSVISRMFVYPDSDDSEDDTTMRHQVYEACRGFQTVFGEARERALKALAFAKTLRKDLEVSAEFTINETNDLLIQRLLESDHIRVKAPHSSEHHIFISGNIRDKHDHIIQLLDMHCGSSDQFQQQMGKVSDLNNGYLVLLKLKKDALNWAGDTIYIKPTAETTISLSQIEVDGVLLVAPNASVLGHRRKEFMKAMKETIIVKHDQRATSQKIACSLEQVKQEALNLREKLSQELCNVQEKCDVSGMGDLDPGDKEALSRRTREILHQCYKFGFEFHKELDRLVTSQVSRANLARGIVNFAKQWMNFVRERCDRGKGTRPRWASHGIDFLYMASSPNFTKHLTTEEFNQFKAMVEDCYNYVIGEPGNDPPRSSLSPGERPSSATSKQMARSSSRSRASSPSGSTGLRKLAIGLVSKSVSETENLSGASTPTVDEVDKMDKIAMPPPNSPFPRRHKKSSNVDEPDTPDVTYKVPPYAHLPWSERVSKSVEIMEKSRDTRRFENGIIGAVLDKARREDRVHIKSKTVSFSWQRGNKIGQGHFGKVYTAINNQTGDIMAMKEIPLQPNDHKTLKNVADELRNFESIHHKHLINHYGVEVHREEMLIFMEYCPEGTLEELVNSTETGLEESLIRRYTRQLVEAVAVLHENGVVHRDIKGANIFLTDEMKNLKLGDFGCAVKIKAHTTMPGELQGFVGTQAFMAPEVFTKNLSEGHGRAADIWSVGCVVIEMATGKRPWHELESNYQIMFKVGMGESPPIPDRLSTEGKDFLGVCFEHDPRFRATAEDLLSRPFLKFFEEEENQSFPIFQSLADLGLGVDIKKMNLVRKSSNY